MKVAHFVMMSLLTQVTVSGASQTLNFCAKDVPIKDIFKVIKCQTGVVFFYDAALLKEVKPVTVEWKNTSLEKALYDIFKSQPYTWILEGKTVTIIKNHSKLLPAVLSTPLVPERPQLPKREVIERKW